MENLKAELMKGVKAQVMAEKLEASLRETVERLRKITPTKSSRVDLEIAILNAESMLMTVKSMEKV